MVEMAQKKKSQSLKILLLLPIGSKRRKRDLNPRAAINDLHPFQGCPFSLLGTSAKSRCLNISKYYIVIGKPFACPTERVGFEPTRPCGQTVFKTASL